jgi:hypothetical protein
MRTFRDMNPTLRGFLIVLGIVAVIFVLQLQSTLFALFILMRIAFVLAIAFWIYMLWRDHKHEISMWSQRARLTFYGAAIVALVDLGLLPFFTKITGPDALAFFVVLGICGFSMWRVWRDQHTYG